MCVVMHGGVREGGSAAEDAPPRCSPLRRGESIYEHCARQEELPSLDQPSLTPYSGGACFELYSYFSACLCVCVCRLTGLVEFVEQSEGLRRDGAWEHGVVQQRAAGEAPLHEPAHVCVLMHVGAAQARIRLQERQRVSPATQVRDACRK
jgi:hypothetical protein